MTAYYSYKVIKKKNYKIKSVHQKARFLAKARHGDVLKPSKPCPQGSF